MNKSDAVFLCQMNSDYFRPKGEGLGLPIWSDEESPKRTNLQSKINELANETHYCFQEPREGAVILSQTGLPCKMDGRPSREDISALTKGQPPASFKQYKLDDFSYYEDYHQ